MTITPNDDDTRITESSGNVFADMGRADADELLAKAELVHQISVTIRERRLTARAAAQMLDLSDDEYARLLRGALSAFSLDRLVHFLNALGRDVQIVVARR